MTDIDPIIKPILQHLLISARLPFTIVRDWTHEVKDSKGTIYAKCNSYELALQVERYLTSEKLAREEEIKGLEFGIIDGINLQDSTTKD